MRFNPVSEEDAAGVLPKGEYAAVVSKATEKTSKASGNPMIELDLTVYAKDGKEKFVRDWLVCTDGGQAKIQRFCKAINQWNTYQAGELSAATCEGANVIVKLGVEEGDGEYPPKNSVRDYFSPKIDPPAKAPQNAATASAGDKPKPPSGDDIPF
jgi:hypothetical protein